MIGIKPQERIPSEMDLSPEDCECVLVSRILPHDCFVIVVCDFLCWDCIQKPVCAAHFVQTALVLGPGQKFVHDDLCISMFVKGSIGTSCMLQYYKITDL